MKTNEALIIVLRAAQSNANGHEDAAKILKAVHIVDGEVLKRSRCSHYFQDTKFCLKCGWDPD